MAKPLLRTLDQIEGADLPLVGGKAFRLATLKQHQFNVPSGLVLTTAFFEAQLQHCQLGPLWAGSPDVAVTTESLEWLASTLKTKPLAPNLLTVFKTELEAVFGPDPDQFAVRSSVIDEDQRDHTFAGVHLTELGVPRSALPIAITRCWASALSGPALAYRQSHGMSIQSIQIAVLIQPMLLPNSSGVAFTINPLTGDRDELIVEATWGLGEAVVRGDIQPYFYKLAAQPPDYPLLERRAGDDTSLAGVAADSAAEPLAETALTELAIQLKQIQALMGEAQDVEWACTANTFYFLQTRPVSLPLPPLQIVDQEWSRASYPEFLPELPSPLFSSLLEQSQKQALAFFEGLGFRLEGLGPYIRLILGRPYLNLTILRRVIAQMGVSPASVLQAVGHTGPETLVTGLSIDWGTVWEARRLYGRVFKRLLQTPFYLKKYKDLVAEVERILATTPLEATLIDQLTRLRQHERLFCQHLEASLGLTSGISTITTLGSSLTAGLTRTPATLLTALAQTGLKTGEGELNQALIRLAQQARQDEQTHHYLVATNTDFRDFAAESLLPEEFKRSLTGLLEQFGEGAVYEADLGQPRYAEDPTPLLNIIRQYALSDFLAEEPRRQAVSWASLTEPAAGLNRFLPWRRLLANIFIDLLRRLLVMRGELDRTRSQAMAICRRWDLALGQKWVGRGWLVQPDDIFWLTLEEIERALMIEEDIGITLSSTIQARKETYQTYGQTQMPFTLTDSQIPYLQPGVGLSTEVLSEVMVGLPISPGQIQGTVLVLQTPDRFEKLSGNTIVVLPSTDPAWLPLLHRADGLIVETGGLLSHGSVIAREYGLPAVANIPHATRRFQTGDRVLVDGSTGIVQFLEP
ncbi:MAG: PEP/pyruvate-binding domain-containing protein, partial [Chloroflexota bacterium]